MHTKTNRQSLNRWQRLLLAAVGSTLAGAAFLPATARADDWTMWGRTPARDMITPEKGIPTAWDVENKQNIKWSQELGSKSYGNPIVANGIVYVGTNNESHRDPSLQADAGVLMAFRESDGKFLWQRASLKLPTGRVNDWPGEGLCSTVYTESSRVWYCTNRCETVCLDVSPGGEPPKVVWSVDMMAKLGVFPHNMTSCAIASYGDLIYVITGNGVDDTHKHVVAPRAPGIVCFNKNTGDVVWTDNSPGENVLHGQWASPAIVEVGGHTLVLAPMGDAWVYAYEAKTGKILWKFDTNPKSAVYPQTRNELIATPVVFENMMYIANGQDPEHGEGSVGDLWCIDLEKATKLGGDVSPEVMADPSAAKPKPGDDLLAAAGSAVQPKSKPNPNSAAKWHFDRFDLNGNGKIEPSERMNRTISTVSVDPASGLLFAPDFSGFLHCLDARTGQVQWNYDMEASIWGSPLICDGKVYLGDEGGFVKIFEIGKIGDKQAKKVAEHDMGSPVYCSPVYANGTLYIMTRDKLFAISDKK